MEVERWKEIGEKSEGDEEGDGDRDRGKERREVGGGGGGGGGRRGGKEEGDGRRWGCSYAYTCGYFRLPSTLTHVEEPYPMLVLCGPPGSGKGYLTKLLVEEFPSFFGLG